MEDGYGSVDLVEGTEEREGDGVVASECDQARVCPAGFGEEARGVGVGVRGTVEKEVVAFFDLFDGIFVVVAWDGWLVS